MEDQLAGLLPSTLSPDTSTRQKAEDDLQQLWTQDSFPLALVSIASHNSIQLEIRQAALLNLKSYVLATWSSSLEEFKGHVFLGDDSKSRLRSSLLELSTSGAVPRKIQNAASYVVSKIASTDYPDQWPNLLQILLHLIPQASDESLHGALKVLAELVQDGLDEGQFFHAARTLVSVLHKVSVDDSKKPTLRALAVSVLRECFNTLEVLMEDHKSDVKAFAEGALNNWIPMFLTVMNGSLPPRSQNAESEGSSDPYYGLIALKIQVARVLVKIRAILPAVISPQSPSLFSAVWGELLRLQSDYQDTYVVDDIDSRMEDPDGLPYTLDFLIQEDLDFLQSCIRAPPVRKELEAHLKPGNDQPGAQIDWMTDLIKLTVAYSQITNEDEGMWAIDVNTFLAEESSVTANYTARIACGDLAIKLGDWLKDSLVQALLQYSKTLFSEPQEWKRQEACLYILDQILHEWHDLNRDLDIATAQAFMELAQYAQKQEQSFLRARGFIVSGTLLSSSQDPLQANASAMMTDNLKRINEDGSEVVQVSCVRALQSYLQAIPRAHTQPLQPAIIQALQQWVSFKETTELAEGDDMLITLVETLRDVIMLDTRNCITGDGLNVLFSIVSQSAESFQVSSLVSETFEDICTQIIRMGGDAYVQLCQKVLPSLTGAFNIGNLTEENALTSVRTEFDPHRWLAAYNFRQLAAELLATLSKFAPEPLPPGYVSVAMPKLNRLLLGSEDEELLKNCTISVKHMLVHDSHQFFNWSEGGKGGLEIVLVIIDRLLGPTVDDNSAAEVGGLAAAVVEKAGSDRLGPFLTRLLEAVAVRLASAERAHFVQSLIMVFARLSMTNPQDVVDFLSQLRINNESGLQIVMSKWLESSPSFAGYDDIRQNIVALSKLYGLCDQRLAPIMVKGDMIVPQSDTIMTRSRAKKNPDQFTIIPVPLKIVKLLVDELISASGPGTTAGAGAAAAEAVADEEDESEEDEEWVDEASPFVAGLASAKSEFGAFAEENPGSARRQADDATQAYLETFFREQSQDGRFQEVFATLTPQEQEKLRTLE